MIVDLIVSAVLGIFNAVFGLIPMFSIELPGAEGVATTAAWANTYFPLSELLACAGVLIGARLFLASFAFFQWLYDKIPFKAT